MAKKIMQKLRTIYNHIYNRLFKLFKAANEKGEIKVKDVSTVADLIIAFERGYFVANHYDKKLTEKDIMRMFDNLYFLLSKK